jgi:hypothetical protein
MQRTDFLRQFRSNEEAYSKLFQYVVEKEMRIMNVCQNFVDVSKRHIKIK